MAVNSVVIQGRTVEAPSCGTTNSGTDYANFRLAWSEKYKDRENKLFIDCKAFGGTAKFISQWFNSKGADMAVTGKLNTEEWEKDGQKRSKIVLMVDSVHFCGKKQEGGSTPTTDPSGGVVVETDELPF